jgi:hypothetical protein
MVVPYIKPIAKPSDSRVNELDGEMTAVLSNPQLSIEEKIREYSQALSRFQSHFDPHTYGESSTSLDMAETIRSIADEAVQAKVDRYDKVKEDAKTKDAIVTAIKSKPTHYHSHRSTTNKKRKISSNIRPGPLIKSQNENELEDEGEYASADEGPEIKPSELAKESKSSAPVKTTKTSSEKKPSEKPKTSKLPKITESGMDLDKIRTTTRRVGSNNINNQAGVGLWHKKKFFF